jgi:hypothetical protein
MADHLALTANPAIWDHEDHLVDQDHLANLERKAHLVIPAKLLARDPDLPDHLDRQADQEDPDNQENPVNPAMTEIPAARDLLETLEHQVTLADPEAPDHPATMVVQVQLAVAIIARRLVWHLVISLSLVDKNKDRAVNHRLLHFSTTNRLQNRNPSISPHLLRRSMSKMQRYFIAYLVPVLLFALYKQ